MKAGDKEYFATLCVGHMGPSPGVTRVELFTTHPTIQPNARTEDALGELMRCAQEFYEEQDLLVYSWNLMPDVLNCSQVQEDS